MRLKFYYVFRSEKVIYWLSFSEQDEEPYAKAWQTYTCEIVQNDLAVGVYFYG